MFVGLGALALALAANHWPWWAVCVAGFLVLILGVFAARGSYTQKSIDRIALYDRDFKNLKSERTKAATYLLKKGGKESDVDDVLDFFDSPLGNLTDSGYLDENLVYDFFFNWIHGYWSACKGHVEAKRGDDNTIWENVVTLHGTVCEIHRRKQRKWAKANLKGEELTEFLERLERGFEDVLQDEVLREFLESELE